MKTVAFVPHAMMAIITAILTGATDAGEIFLITFFSCVLVRTKEFFFFFVMLIPVEI
jgi:hypothetical protein